MTMRWARDGACRPASVRAIAPAAGFPSAHPPAGLLPLASLLGAGPCQPSLGPSTGSSFLLGGRTQRVVAQPVGL